MVLLEFQVTITAWAPSLGRQMLAHDGGKAAPLGHRRGHRRGDDVLGHRRGDDDVRAHDVLGHRRGDGVRESELWSPQLDAGPSEKMSRRSDRLLGFSTSNT